MLNTASIKRILVPVDFSSHSRNALLFAKQLSVALEANLSVLHVHEPAGYMGTDTLVMMPVGLASERWEETRNEAMDELTQFLGADRSSVLELKVEPGLPGDVIPVFARGAEIDLIVMGTHGRSGLSRLLVGSVAESVMRKAHCPVVTLRMPVKVAHESVPM